MLSKLLKHEFMVTWKIPVLLDAVLIGLGLMSYVALRAVPHMEDSIGVLVLLFALIGIFYIGLIAASIILQIYLVLRYYRLPPGCCRLWQSTPQSFRSLRTR